MLSTKRISDAYCKYLMHTTKNLGLKPQASSKYLLTWISYKTLAQKKNLECDFQTSGIHQQIFGMPRETQYINLRNTWGQG